VLVEVMFSRPFADFDPGPPSRRPHRRPHSHHEPRPRRCVDAGDLQGDPTDLGHIIIALAQGLARQETAGWLGQSRESVDRRWNTAFARLLR